jgi:ABC-type spermidine/putrescine transport system permease subunit II
MIRGVLCFCWLDWSLEDASRNLGATGVRRSGITFSLIRPGVFAGAIFSFIMSTTTSASASSDPRTPPTSVPLTRANSVADNTLAAVSVALVIVTLLASTLAERCGTRQHPGASAAEPDPRRRREMRAALIQMKASVNRERTRPG